MLRLYKWLFTAVFFVFMPLGTMAAAEEPLLVISGNVTKLASDGVVKLTRQDLESLPQTAFETTTIWTDGKHKFTGVSLTDLLDAVGAKGSRMRATALNDYAIEVPVSDAVAGGPIIAHRMDGEQMSVRDKGPLWLVYPYDSNSDYRTETIYARSIWQLNRLEIIK